MVKQGGGGLISMKLHGLLGPLLCGRLLIRIMECSLGGTDLTSHMKKQVPAKGISTNRGVCFWILDLLMQSECFRVFSLSCKTPDL